MKEGKEAAGEVKPKKEKKPKAEKPKEEKKEVPKEACPEMFAYLDIRVGELIDVWKHP